MGKKKNKNKTAKSAKNLSYVNAGSNGASGKKFGFGGRKKTPKKPEKKFAWEISKMKQEQNLRNKKKQITEADKELPDAGNRAADIPGLGKRHAQGGSKGSKQKKRKQNATEPGRFVKANVSPPESTVTAPKMSPKKKQENLERTLCKVNAEDGDFGYSDESYSDSMEEYFGDDNSANSDLISTDSEFNSTDSELNFMDSEDSDLNTTIDEEEDSWSDEETDEEFSTDTDYTESPQEWQDSSINSSEDDVEYDPGDEYDDVIVPKGGAKYSDISDTQIKFDDSYSHIFEYFSDDNEKTADKRKEPEKHLDTRKAVVRVERIPLDKLPTLPVRATETAVKGKKQTCSQECSHQQTSPGKISQNGAKESPLSSLKYKESEEMHLDKPEDVAVPEIPEVQESLEENPAESTTEICDDEEESGTANFYNAIDSHNVLLHLTESIHFHGNLSIQLVAGSASVLGYSLDTCETVTAHAPIGYSSVSITPNPSESFGNWTESLNLKEMFFEEDLKRIEDELKPFHAILLLHKHSNLHVKMVKKYSMNRVFPNMNIYKRPRPYASTEYILQCRFSFHSKQNLQVNPDWEFISVEEKSRIVVTGGKNVGKTTLIRHLLNKNVKKHGEILLIDLDIGQPEVSLPQTVSVTLLDHPILGLGCFMDKQPDKSYLFGELNVANAPQRYFECVSKLFQDIQGEERFRNIPWIVNTMGYVRGVGLELMVALLRLISPTDVVQIAHEIQLENFDFEITDSLVNGWIWRILDGEALLLEPCEKFKTFCYQTMVSGNLRKSKASETRQMSILAHLGGILKGDYDWITQSRPICVSLDKLKIFNSTDEDIDEHHVTHLLTANLVYLCKKSEDSDILQSLGIGIVRGIDENLQMLYLLPSTRQNLDQVNSLAICQITLPPQLILNQNSGVQGELPYVYNTDESIASRNVVTKAFRPESAIVNMYSKNDME